MAMFVDPSDALGRGELLREFGANLRGGAAAGPSATGAYDIAGKGIAEGAKITGSLPRGTFISTGIQDRLARLGGLLRGGSRILGGLAKTAAPIGLLAEGVGDIVSGDSPATGAFRTATGVAGLLGPAGKAFAGGVAGGELAAQGVAALAPEQTPVLSPGFTSEVKAAGGTGAFVKGVQEKQGAELEAKIKQDAEAQKFTDARTARVNEVIAASQAGRAQDEQAATTQSAVDTITARRANIEDQLAALQMPEQITGFGNIASGLQSTAAYVAKRNQLARQARALAVESEGEKGRGLAREQIAATTGIKREEIIADTQKELLKARTKLMEPKVVTVKSGLEEVPMLVRGSGEPIAGYGIKGGQPTSLEPAIQVSRSQALVQAQARLDAAPKKDQAKIKRQINEKLKQDYGESAPQLP